MTHEGRHLHIIESTASLFGNHSPDTVTTRDIASAAGISEALLYRHFASKYDLFTEVINHYFSGIALVCGQLQSVPTSTESLIFLVYALFALTFRSVKRNSNDARLISRIMIRSITGDGKYAKRVLSTYEPVHRKMVACYEEATRRGDVEAPQKNGWTLLWFCHHLAAYLGFLHNADPKIVDHCHDKETTHLEAVRVCLRGMGVSESVLLSVSDFGRFNAKLETHLVGFKAE